MAENAARADALTQLYQLPITIVGRAEGGEARDLLDASQKEFAPAKVVELVAPVDDAPWLTALGYPPLSDGGTSHTMQSRRGDRRAR